MNSFSTGNAISNVVVKLQNYIGQSDTTPTVDLAPVELLKADATGTLLTTIPINLSAKEKDENFDTEGETVWLTGGVITTNARGATVARYTASARGLSNDFTNNPPEETDSDVARQQQHEVGAVCILQADWLFRNIESLFQAGSTTTLKYEAKEDIAVRRSVSNDSGFYNFQSTHKQFIGISTETMTSGNSYSIATWGALVTGFTGLTSSGIVYADYVDEPATPLTSTLAGTGAGNVDDGDHVYKVTFVTSQGETIGGTASTSVTVADKTADGKIELTDIPVSGNANVTSRKIYRQFAGTGDFLLLTTLADNTTTTYTDDTANASLTDTEPTVTTNNGLITQQATTTALAIGKAEGTTAVRLTPFPVQNATFYDGTGEFMIVNKTDTTKELVTDLSGKTTNTTTTFKFDGGDQTITFPDGNFTVADASDIPNSIITKNVNAVIGGVTAGQFVYIDQPAETADATSLLDIGYATTYSEKRAFKLIGNGTSATTIKLNLTKYGTPTDSFQIRIETDNAGEPSGTLADANAVAEVTGASLTTSLVDTTATFTDAFTLDDGTLYHVVLTRTGTLSATDYFKVGVKLDDSFYSTSVYQSSAWTSETNKRAYFEFAGAYSDVLSLCDGTFLNKKTPFGMTTEIAVFGNTTKIDTGTILETSGTLTFGKEYYISDTAGEICELSDNPTFGDILGVAITATKIILGKGENTKFRANMGVETLINADTSVTITHGLLKRPKKIMFYPSGSYTKTSGDTNPVLVWTDVSGTASPHYSSLNSSTGNIDPNTQATINDDEVTNTTFVFRDTGGFTGGSLYWQVEA